jgi:hypothetical protein
MGLLLQRSKLALDDRSGAALFETPGARPSSAGRHGSLVLGIALEVGSTVDPDGLAA